MTNSNKRHTPHPAPMAMMAYSGRAAGVGEGGVVVCGVSDEGGKVGGIIVGGTEVGCVSNGPEKNKIVL